MKRLTVGVAVMMTMGFAAAPALACRIAGDFNAEDVNSADLIVVGRIQNYRVVQQRYPYAQFDVLVDRVVKGGAPPRLTAILNTQSGGVPKTLSGDKHFVALRKVQAGSLGDMKFSWQVVATTCGPSYLFPMNGHQADRVRRFFKF